MIADEFPEMGAVSPTTLKGTPVSLHLYVEDVDTTVPKAVAAGAKERGRSAQQAAVGRLAPVHPASAEGEAAHLPGAGSRAAGPSAPSG